MTNLVRTTITMEGYLLQELKLYALTHRTTLSAIVSRSTQREIRSNRKIETQKKVKRSNSLDEAAFIKKFVADPVRYRRVMAKAKAGKKIELNEMAGLLKLGGKELPSRQEMYDEYLKEKLGY